MRRIFGTLAIAFALCSVAWGQADVFITGTNYYTVLGRGIAWGTGVNNNFIFSAVNPNTQVCLYVTNNNPSSSHTFTLALWQAGDPQVKTFQNLPSKWAQSGTTQVFPVTVTASTTVGVYFNVTAAALLTAQFTGSSLQAGSPDTADIFAVQTTAGACGLTSGTPLPVLGAVKQGASVTAANQFPIPIGGYSQPGTASTVQGFAVGNAGNGFPLEGGVCCHTIGQGFIGSTSGTFAEPKAMNANPSVQLAAVFNSVDVTTFGQKGVVGGGVHTDLLEIASDQYNISSGNIPGWTVLGKLTNPTAGQVLLSQFQTTAAATNPEYRRLVLTCSAACEILVARMTARGTTCTGLTPQNLQVGNNSVAQAPSTGDITENACTGAPTLGTSMFDLTLAAGIPYSLDLSGIVNFHSGTNGGGIAVEVVAGITGIATASLQYVEQ